jgi:(E)-4-hydroxy-3-methyl-but-2-enyl pyrophosphate reductase
MKVILAKSAGFCWGVSRAVEKARHLAQDKHAPIWTDGPLIHNRQMVAELEKEGIRESARPEDLHDGTLLIRAHGIPPDRLRLLSELPLNLEDATCPDVARIQDVIKRHAAQGFHILIFGDPGHAEVIGLLGYAEQRGHVVSLPEDVDRLPNAHPVCLVSQSTQFPAAYAGIAAAVRRRFPDATVLDTICKSTKNRQQELVKIAAETDALVVVGGLHSANTLRLVELARTLRPTFHVQTADQIGPADFRGICTVGLTAGASTPQFIIEQVRTKLEGMPQGVVK